MACVLAICPDDCMACLPTRPTFPCAAHWFRRCKGYSPWGFSRREIQVRQRGRALGPCAGLQMRGNLGRRSSWKEHARLLHTAVPAAPRFPRALRVPHIHPAAAPCCTELSPPFVPGRRTVNRLVERFLLDNYKPHQLSTYALTLYRYNFKTQDGKGVPVGENTRLPRAGISRMHGAWRHTIVMPAGFRALPHSNVRPGKGNRPCLPSCGHCAACASARVPCTVNHQCPAATELTGPTISPRWPPAPLHV